MAGSRTVAALLAVVAIAFGPSALAAQTCPGDCDDDRVVSIDELLRCVSIALGAASSSECGRCDSSGEGAVTIDDLIRAVHSALTECSSADPLLRGLNSFGTGDVRAAERAFALAATLQRDDDRAKVYHAMVRVAAALLTAPELRALADRGGVIIYGSAADVCRMEIESPASIPAGAPRSGEILDTVRAVLLPEILAAIEEVERVSDAVNIEFDLQDLPDCLRPRTDRAAVEIDRTDVLLLATALKGSAALLELLTSYDLDAGLRTIDEGPARAVLEAEPQLLSRRFAGRLETARNWLDGALADVIAAIDAARSESDDQHDDLFVILPEDGPDADRVKRVLQLVRQSLSGEALFPVEVGLSKAERLNLSLLFSGRFSTLRTFLPPFDAEGAFDPHRFPDPTFGNTIPDLTQGDIDDVITGGPRCAPCQSDGECGAFGFTRLTCRACQFGCTGEVRRCGPENDIIECEDGFF